jgi:hypothetical protein
VSLTHRAEQAWGGLFLDDTTLLARKEFMLATYDVGKPGEAIEHGKARNFRMADIHRRSGTVVCSGNTGSDPASQRSAFTVCSFERGELAIKQTIGLGPGASPRPVLDPTGERVAGIWPGEKIEIFEVRTGASMLKLQGKFVTAVFRDAHTLITARRGGKDEGDEVVAFDAQTGAELRRVALPLRVSALALSPDAQHLAVGGSDWKIHLLDPATLAETAAFRAHDNDITALAFHPTKAIIASASADRSVKLWEYPAAKLEQEFIGLGGTPVVLAFNPSGTLLLVDGQEHTTRIFDVTGKE